MAISRAIDGATNARFYAWTRFAAGLIAITKGAELLSIGVAPAVVLPWMAATALFTAGVLPRLTGGVVVALGFYLLQGEYNNHFYALLLVVLFATLSESRAAFALGATGQSQAPRWPAALMGLQASVIYTYAGLAKLNPEWLSGDVLAFHFELGRFGLPTGDWFVLPLAVVVPLLELFAGLALWSNRWRAAAFGILLPLHAGMLSLAYSWNALYGVGIFAPITFLMAQAWAIPERPRLVVWDDNCSFCRKWVRLFGALDAFGGLRFVGSSRPQAYDGTGVTPEAAAAAMQFVGGDGTVYAGFAAVGRIVHTLPFGFLVSPWFALPGVRQLGERAYARVAARRSCAVEESPVAAGRAAP